MYDSIIPSSPAEHREKKPFSHVPDELKQLPKWVLWKEVIRDGKSTKVPYSVTGSPAKSNDPSTWSTFQEAVDHCKGYNGIGFMFSADDPYVGIDLDGCRDPETGRVCEWATEIAQRVNSYTEISPSGTGVKIWCRAKPQTTKGIKTQLGITPVCDKLPGIEIYSHRRYFAVTGERLDTCDSGIKQREEAFNWLTEKYFPQPEGKPPQPSTKGRRREHSGSDTVERCRKYVAKMEPSVSGQRGHDKLLAAAGVCAVGFNLSKPEALEVLHEFNAHCQPPWPDSELARKYDEALNTTDKASGYLLEQSQPVENNGKAHNQAVNNRTEQKPSRNGTQPPSEASTIEDLTDIPQLEFPVGALPECVAGIIQAVAHSMVVPLAYAGAVILPLLSMCIGATHTLRIKNGWFERAILWVLVVGNSGTGKSHPLSKLAEALIDLDFQRIAENDQRRKEYEEALAVYTAEKKSWEAERKRLQRAGEDADIPPPEKPDEPVEVRGLIQDATLEEVVRLHQMNPRGLGIIVDEADSWLSSFNSYRSGRGGDESKWLSIHSGKHVMNDRKTVRGSYVKRPTVSLVSTTQPQTLAAGMKGKSVHNGLYPRFLFVNPPERERVWTDADVPQRLLEQLRSVYQRLQSLTFVVDEFGDKKSRLVDLGEPARKLWVDQYNRNGEETKQETGIIRAALSKMPGQLARIALVLHCTDCVWNGTPPDTIPLSESTMRNAIILADYFANESRRVFTMFTTSPEDLARAELVELIKSKGGEVTPRDLQHSKRKYRKDVSRARADLDDLAIRNLGEWDDPKAMRKFTLSKAVTVTDFQEADAETTVI